MFSIPVLAEDSFVFLLQLGQIPLLAFDFSALLQKDLLVVFALCLQEVQVQLLLLCHHSQVGDF